MTYDTEELRQLVNELEFVQNQLELNLQGNNSDYKYWLSLEVQIIDKIRLLT